MNCHQMETQNLLNSFFISVDSLPKTLLFRTHTACYAKSKYSLSIIYIHTWIFLMSWLLLSCHVTHAHCYKVLCGVTQGNPPYNTTIIETLNLNIAIIGVPIILRFDRISKYIFPFCNAVCNICIISPSNSHRNKKQQL